MRIRPLPRPWPRATRRRMPRCVCTSTDPRLSYVPIGVKCADDAPICTRFARGDVRSRQRFPASKNVIHPLEYDMGERAPSIDPCVPCTFRLSWMYPPSPPFSLSPHLIPFTSCSPCSGRFVVIAVETSRSRTMGHYLRCYA